MRSRITYTDEPLGDLKIVPDFLPSPEELPFARSRSRSRSRSTWTRSKERAGSASQLLCRPRDLEVVDQERGHQAAGEEADVVAGPGRR